MKWSFRLGRFFGIDVDIHVTFIFLLVTGTIAAMERFGDVWVFGGPSGSPARSLQTVVLYIYEVGFGSFDFGLASAAAYVLFALTMALTLLNFWLFLRSDMRAGSS